MDAGTGHLPWSFIIMGKLIGGTACGLPGAWGHSQVVRQ